MKIYIRSDSSADDEAQYWAAVQSISDDLNSDNTFLSQKVPNILKKIKLDSGTLNLNYGKRLISSGNANVIAEYYIPLNLVNITLDPFDSARSRDKNVISIIRKYGGADTATVINILHEIDKDARATMINNLQKLVKPGGKLYFVSYGDINNDGADDEIDDFFDEIQTYFANVKKVNDQVVVAVNTSKGSTGTVKTSARLFR